MHLDTVTTALLALSVGAVGLTLFLNPFGARGFAAFALTGLANTVFLVQSSLADRIERMAGSIFGFVVLIVIASYRTNERIAETKAKEEAAFRERYGDSDWRPGD